MFGDDVSEFDALFTVSGNKKYMFGDDVSEFDATVFAALCLVKFHSTPSSPFLPFLKGR